MADQEAARDCSGEVRLLITLHTRVHCNGGLAAYGVEEMSEQIDWSKAPDDATHYQAEAHGVFECWLKPGHAVRVSRSDPDWREDEYADDLIATSAIKRPWSSEGLPPIGVVCEANFVGSWTEFELRYYGETYVIFKTRYEVQRTRIDFDACGVKFRPIRTPEQMAADERQKMADMLWQRYLQPILAPAQEAQVKTALGLIYDDFYRKP